MGRLIIVIVCLGLFFNTMWSQTSAVADINAIKMQTELYVYAESSSATMDEALDFAKILLKEAIQGWLIENNLEATDIMAQAESKVAMIEARRGSMYRVFLYVPKSDLQAISNSKSLNVGLGESSSVDDNKANFNGNVYNDDLSDFEELSDVMEDSQIQNNNQEQNDELVEEHVISRTPLEEQMLTITKAQDIQIFVKNLQSEGKLSRFGKYADMPSDISCYIFVYDRDMNIPAYLRKEGVVLINLVTGEIDDIKNYRGCGAIWFKLKY